MRKTFHFILIVPAVIGLAVTAYLANQSVRSDVSDESFPNAAEAAWSAIFAEIPAKMPGDWANSEEEAPKTADDISPDQAHKFAVNNAFIASCALLVMLGVLGIALLGAATTSGEPMAFPLVRTAAMSGVAILSFLLWGFYLAYPGDFNGVISFPTFGFPGEIDSVEYGMEGMTEWTDLFYIAAYAAVFGSLLISFCSARMKATAAFLAAIPITILVLPIVISWKWGGGWIDQLGNNIDFAGAALFHWHAGAIGLLTGGILTMFLRQPENRELLKEKQKLGGLQTSLYGIGLVFYFLLIVAMNTGSVLSAAPDMVASILQATLIAAGISLTLSVIWWAVLQTRSFIQFAGIGLISGAISVSGTSDTLSIVEAISLGVLCGFVVPGVVAGLDKIGWPDPLAVGPVHGIGGAIAILGAALSAQGESATLVGQIVLLISVPLLSLMIAFFVVLIAGISKVLFVRQQDSQPNRMVPPDLPRRA